ncbi:MAG: glycine zipper family protein [Syntrophales bacterium]
MKRIIFILICLSLAGCAGHRPLVDFKGSAPNKNAVTYEDDLKECQQYAESISVGGNAVAGAVIGAGVGAAFGAIIYSIVGLDPSDGVAFGATLGGIDGAVAGTAGAAQNQMTIISNCMRGRGYSVLN